MTARRLAVCLLLLYHRAFWQHFVRFDGNRKLVSMSDKMNHRKRPIEYIFMLSIGHNMAMN